uniref:hypothetical protein n=1 Tax=Flavobacterium sp. TaxID=239 RepID=UPI00404B4F5D
MKSKLMLFCIVSLILNACKEPLVSFEIPQPENVKTQNEFPKNLLGTYYNPSKNEQLIIDKSFILKKITLDDTLKFSELDKNELIKHDTLYKTTTNEKYKIKIINDSLFTNYCYSDTIFNLKSDILKKFKGYYFLNNSIEKTGFWEVRKLNYTKGVLSINGIETENEINLIASITETKKDTSKPFRIKPTKKQFKAFIKKNGFSEGETYLKE